MVPWRSLSCSARPRLPGTAAWPSVYSQALCSERTGRRMAGRPEDLLVAPRIGHGRAHHLRAHLIGQVADFTVQAGPLLAMLHDGPFAVLPRLQCIGYLPGILDVTQKAGQGQAVLHGHAAALPQIGWLGMGGVAQNGGAPAGPGLAARDAVAAPAD